MAAKERDAWWHCRYCGDHERADEPYEIGDKEPCISCGEGTAVVMTLKDAAALESAIARGIRKPKRSYTP